MGAHWRSRPSVRLFRCQTRMHEWLFPLLTTRALCLAVLQVADSQAMRCQLVWGLSLCRVSRPVSE